MAIRISVTRTAAGTLAGFSAYDAELIRDKIAVGETVYADIKRQSKRSQKMHRLFFAGLLPIAYQYWIPEISMLTDAERNILLRFAARVDGDKEEKRCRRLVEEFMREVTDSRKKTYGEAPPDIEVFREWLTIEAGYYHLVNTPTGIRKVAKSIAFHAMSQEEFEQFYKACFDVAWNLLLKTRFPDEAAANAAVQELLSVS